ncbi:hypothetical protein PENTCL1PPCAC_13192, partial [Pristionchus entomophagus]
MTDPPVKRSKSPLTITMLPDFSQIERDGQISPVHRSYGLAWRLQVSPLSRHPAHYGAVLHCDSEGSELWRADAKITLSTKQRSCMYDPSKSPSGQVSK